MSLEVINNQLAVASNLLDLNRDEQGLLAHRMKPVQYRFGPAEVQGQTLEMARMHCGPDAFNGYEHTPFGQGGIRAHEDPNYLDTLEMLSRDMTLKEALLELTTPDAAADGMYFHGAKGFIQGNIRRLGPAGISRALEHFAERMYDSGLYTRDGVAGDMNTNGMVGRIYPRKIFELSGGTYDLWRATASGKSPEDGGLAFRPAATGYGVYAAQGELLRQRGLSDTHLTVSIQGCGNVAGWYAHFAGQNEQLGVTAMSDMDGTVWTSDPAGFELDEAMVRAISDNPEANGSRAEQYYKALCAKYGDKLDIRFTQDSNAVLDIPVDIFVPAAGKHTITAKNCQRLQVRQAIIEAANDPQDADALAYADARGIPVLSGFASNGGGVYVSLQEIKANRMHAKYGDKLALPSVAQTRDNLHEAMTTAVGRVLAAQEKYNTPTIADAAAAVAIHNLVRHRP